MFANTLYMTLTVIYNLNCFMDFIKDEYYYIYDSGYSKGLQYVDLN